MENTIKITKNKNVDKETADLVVKLTKLCLKEISKKKYEITSSSKPVTYKELLDACNIKITNNWSTPYGGKRGIKIDVFAYTQGDTYCNEYKAYRKSPVIGGYYANPEIVLLGIIAHEVSHFIQHAYGPTTRTLKKTYKKPHGEGFKMIYRYLRQALVNQHVEKFSHLDPQYTIDPFYYEDMLNTYNFRDCKNLEQNEDYIEWQLHLEKRLKQRAKTPPRISDRLKEAS